MWRFGVALGAMVLASVAIAAEAQTAAPTLTLERVFASPDLAGPQPQALQLSPDGTLLTSVRPRADDRSRFDLWALDTRTGAERMLVDSLRTGSGAELSEAAKMQRERDRTLTGKTGILEYDWAPDGRSLLVPVDGELYLADLNGGVRKLEGTKDALNPTVSPRGQFIGFVRDQNLWVRPLSGDATARQLTKDGRGTVHWGEAEFIAQEEMHRRTGYWWSPDDRYLAVARFDEAPVKVFTRAAIGATGTRVFEQRYPAAGTDNVLIELHVMRADGSGSVKVDLGGDPDIYLARVDWTLDGQLLVQRQNRAQTRLDVLRVDPATGRSTLLFTENAAPKSWINLSDAYRMMRDGSLLWLSERDGFAHLWRLDKGKWTQLTRGPWVVSALAGVDEVRGRVYFMANKDDVLEQQLYALDLKSGAITRLTEAGWFNKVVGSGDAIRFIVTRSNPNQPPQTYLADADGRRLAWINENRVEGTHPYAPYLAAHQPVRFGTVKAADGKTDLYWQMVTPKLEPGKRYPVFFQHYGGPGPQSVQRNWKNPLIQQLVAKGWIYFEVDNRGAANRGVAFESAIWHAMGTVEVADQARGAAYLKTLPFVDPARIATYGWSYGGYMSLKMIEADQKLYAASVSGAPVTDWRLYDTHWTERYMGDPRTDKAAYDASRAVIDPRKITTPLMLMHGMADDNVFLDNSTEVAARMQAADVPFEMMFYPGKAHGAARDIHVWTTIEAFLDRHVGSGPR